MIIASFPKGSYPEYTWATGTWLVAPEVLHAVLEIVITSELLALADKTSSHEGLATINVSSALNIYGLAIVLELCRIYKIEWENRNMKIPYEDRIYNVENIDNIYEVRYP